MATTRIISMHLNKGKTLAQCLTDRTEYGMNPDKTDGGELISSFACEPETVVSEFALSKREYRELTGRVQESDIIAYQIRHENQKQSIRLDSLGEGYSEQELRTVLTRSKTHNPFVKKKYPKRKERTTLISEIEAKLNSGKGYWYNQTMKVVKLKQMAKTFVYLEEQGFADYAELANAAATAEGKFNDLKAAIKAAETRMSEIQTLRTHIINYSKTREVYAGYRKAGYSKKYLSEHESDIIIHKVAKKAFDDFGLKKLPTVKSLNE